MLSLPRLVPPLVLLARAPAQAVRVMVSLVQLELSVLMVQLGGAVCAQMRLSEEQCWERRRLAEFCLSSEGTSGGGGLAVLGERADAASMGMAGVTSESLNVSGMGGSESSGYRVLWPHCIL